MGVDGPRRLTVNVLLSCLHDNHEHDSCQALPVIFFRPIIRSMKPQEKLYELGVERAFREYIEKQAKSKVVSDVASKAKTFFDTLAGHNIEKAIGEQHANIMKSPLIVRQAKKTPKDMSTVESYVTKALRSKKELPGVRKLTEKEFREQQPRVLKWLEGKLPKKLRQKLEDRRYFDTEHFELPRQTKGRQQLVEDLTKGHRAVKAQRGATRKARLLATGAVGVPAVGASLLAKESSLVEDDSSAPAVAAGAAGSLPIIQGLRSGALGMPEAKGRALTLEQLEKTLRPGDILLTSQPGYSSAFKAPIAAMGGDPYGYHVETVMNNPKSGAPRYIHSTPAEGGAAFNTGRPITEQDVIVKRLKDQSKVKEFVKNLKGYGKREEVLRNMLGLEAPMEMYDKSTAIKGGAKSFIPERLRRFFFKDTAALPGATVCSTLPGMACPVDLAPGVAKHEIMPHHLQRSAALETVGHYRAPRKAYQTAYEGLLRAAPWITRGALGLGLGYGAYKGMQALLD